MSASSLTDLQLVDRLRSDDHDAFSEIYRRYADGLAGFAASKLYSLEDAKDIIHDVFFKLWTERKTSMIDRDLRAYLFKLTRYRIVDKIRKNITREQYADIIQALNDPFDISTEQRFAARELQASIESSLTQLSPRVVEIFRLSREQHLSVAEIAERLQLSERTVKNQLTTALKHLRSSLSLLSTSSLLLYILS